MGNWPGKKVNNADAGDADHVGGNDWDDMVDYHNNVDKTGPVKIDTRTYYRSGKLELRNPADTFSYIINTDAILADRTLSLPLLTGNATFSFPEFAQTWTAAQTFASSMLKIRNPGDTFSYTIVAAAIAADRNLNLPLITGTDTLAALGLAQTWTAAQTFNNSLLKIRNPADTFSYTIVPAAIAANRNITLPLLTGNDTAVTEAFDQILSNKGIDAEVNDLGMRSWTVVCFKVGSTYYARSHTGALISSSTTAETVLAAALTQKGVIYLANTQTDNSGTTTDWNLSGSFTGFTVNSETTIIGSHHTRIMVPDGFTGVCFTVNPSVIFEPAESVSMQGFQIAEQGTPDRNWDAIKIQVDADQEFMAYAVFRDLYIRDCDIGIELESTHATSFINGNRFDDIIVYRPKTAGFLFDLSGGGGMTDNVFTNCQVQWLAGTTLCGFKDVDGDLNQFIGCTVWDGEESIAEMNIKATAVATKIIGGRIGRTGVIIDRGIRTLLATDSLKGGPRAGYMMAPSYGKTGAWYGIAPTVGDGMFNGSMVAIAVGTGANSQSIDSSGNFRLFDTGSTINSLSGVRCNLLFARRILNSYFKAGIQLNNNTNMRVFCGIVADNTAPASAADPLNAKSGIGLWLDTAVSANWKVMHNDGVGASATIDTTVAAATGTFYTVEIAAKNDNRFSFIMNNGFFNNLTSNIPASLSSCDFWLYVENTTGASRVIRGYYVEMRADS